MKFNGRSGVQLRAPRDLSDLAAYTALKFYLQSPKLASGQVTGDRFVLYMGSRQVLGGHSRHGGLGGARHQVGGGGGGGWGWVVLLCWDPFLLSLPPPPQAVGDYMGVALRDQKVHWVYRLGEAGPATLSVDENIGEQFAAVSIDRWVAGPPVLPRLPGGVHSSPPALPSGPSSSATCPSRWRSRRSMRPRPTRWPLGPRGCLACILTTSSSTWGATPATSR